MVIGLGSDGHFCGNMPKTTDFDSISYEAQIKPEYPGMMFLSSYTKVIISQFQNLS